MALTMHAYNDTHGRMPSAAVCGEDGKPLYSWRVLILPFIGEDELFADFRLDEPWDSSHNIELLPRMPATYAPPPGKRWKVPPYHTVMHVFHGKGAAFEGSEGLRLGADFPDGSSNTILIIEAGEPVPWTKPADLAYDPDGPLPELRPLFKDIIRVGMGDGSMRYMRQDISEKTLRAAITRNGGEILGEDW